MAHYDIFEILPDGSQKWRASASGNYEKERKLQEFKESSKNPFCAVDISDGEFSSPALMAPRPARRVKPESKRPG
jgi:hypothetical protein